MNNQEVFEKKLNSVNSLVEELDEIVCENLNKSEYASKDFKDSQCIGNDLLIITRVLKSINETLKY